MKKCAMRLVVLIVFVAVMCAPSYGDILVYRLQGQFNPHIVFADDSYGNATVDTKNITGYGVFDVDMETGGFNGVPTLIFYENKDKWYYYINAKLRILRFITDLPLKAP